MTPGSGPATHPRSAPRGAPRPPSPRGRRRAEQPRPADWLRVVIPVLLIAALLVVAWKLGYFALEKPGKLNAAASRAERVPWIPAIFVLVYAGAATFAAPVAPLAYGAGALFGLVKGSILMWVGSLIGGTAGYWLAHGVWADAAKRLLGRYEDKIRGLREGKPFLVALRAQLSPIIPFGAFNYAAGATRIPYLPFIAATAIGVIPGGIANVYVGERVAAGVRGGGHGPFIVAAAVMLALIGITFLPGIVRKLKD